jgi:hypothetical protein
MSLRKKRKINPELIHAARSAKLIRTIACCGPITLKPDRSRFRHLGKFLLQKVIKADKFNTPGERNVLKGNLQLLEGYELDQDLPLSKILQASYTSSIDPDSGMMRIYFPSFVPFKQLIYPDNVTHCRIIAVGASLNFDYYNATIESDSSPLIPLIDKVTPGFALNLRVSPRDGQAMMLILGISYIHLPTDDGNVAPLSQAAQILRVAPVNSPLFIRKGDKMLIMNFDEETPF